MIVLVLCEETNQSSRFWGGVVRFGALLRLNTLLGNRDTCTECLVDQIQVVSKAEGCAHVEVMPNN